MILSFNKQQFVDRILEGTKIHTIREDKHNRWKPGNKIHAWYKNPRNVSQNPMDLYTYASYHGYGSKQIEIPTTCISIQEIYMAYWDDSKLLLIKIDNNRWTAINGKYGSTMENEPIYDNLCINDGFNTPQDFYNWFVPVCKQHPDNKFRGKIIHWTNFKY